METEPCKGIHRVAASESPLAWNPGGRRLAPTQHRTGTDRKVVPGRAAVYTLFVLVLLLAPGSAAHSEGAGRVALVVGNSDYTHVGRLPNPANDATDVSAALRRLGFEVTTVRDVGRAAFTTALADFTDRSIGADIALVFYAGHGMEMDGVNYLVPVDARLERGHPSAFRDPDAGRRAAVDRRSGVAVGDSGCMPEQPAGEFDAADGPDAQHQQRQLRRFGRGVARGRRDARSVRGGGKDDGRRWHGPEQPIYGGSVGAFGAAVGIADVVPSRARGGVVGDGRATASARVPVVAGRALLDCDFPTRCEFVWRRDGRCSRVAGDCGDGTGDAVLGVDPADQDPGRFLKRSCASFRTGRSLVWRATGWPALRSAAVERPAPDPPRPDPVRPRPWQAGETFRDCPTCPELVVLPAGTFRMGCVSGLGCVNDELPVREIEVASFALSRYEVTFKEYERFATATGRRQPSDWGWGGGRRPVTGISWEDAVAYVDWLSDETGERYRLPSETEWEYAARAGTRTAYSWGQNIGRNRANCDGCGSRWDDDEAAPVGSFAANAWGLHDMHGNVSEWVADCWRENYALAPVAGSAWRSRGSCDRRVLRGGSWLGDPVHLRSAKRGRMDIGLRYAYVGFRVVRNAGF